MFGSNTVLGLTIQSMAFAAMKIGDPCENVDKAVRAGLVKFGYGPDYKLPGTPHRTGHGIGIDIHEAPYFSASDETVRLVREGGGQMSALAPVNLSDQDGADAWVQAAVAEFLAAAGALALEGLLHLLRRLARKGDGQNL